MALLTSLIIFWLASFLLLTFYGAIEAVVLCIIFYPPVTEFLVDFLGNNEYRDKLSTIQNCKIVNRLQNHLHLAFLCQCSGSGGDINHNTTRVDKASNKRNKNKTNKLTTKWYSIRHPLSIVAYPPSRSQQLKAPFAWIWCNCSTFQCCVGKYDCTVCRWTGKTTWLT